MYIDEVKGKVKTHTSIENDMVKEIRHYDEQGHNYKTLYYSEGKLKSYFEDVDANTNRVLNYEKNPLSPSVQESITNEQGKLMRSSFIDENGKLLWELHNTYNRQDNIISTHYTDENGTTVTSYTYDSNSNLIVKKIAAPDQAGSILYQFQYDELNQLVRKTKSSIDGQVIKTQLYAYENRQQTSFSKYDGNGHLVKLKLHVYNEEGQLIRKTKFNRYESNHPSEHDPADFKEYYEQMQPFKSDINGQATHINPSIVFLDSYTQYQYDQFGNETLSEKFEYREDFSNKRLTLWRGNYHQYNERNLLIKESSIETHTDWDDGHQWEYTYTFDDKGRVIKITSSALVEEFHFNEQDQLVMETKNYHNGEWIEETKYDAMGNATSHTRRAQYKGELSQEDIEVFVIDYYE